MAYAVFFELGSQFSVYLGHDVDLLGHVTSSVMWPFDSS